ncbi:MAG: sec-independent translocase [Nocardioidaceae bacterium]
MFGIGLPEFAVLAMVGIFIFGPEKLPEVAKQAAQLLKSARRALASAKAQVADELGPEYANLDLRDLNPRALIQKHLLDDLDLDDDAPPARPGHRPLEMGEEAPYDLEAT